MPSLDLRFDNCFDAVSVRIEDKSCEIVSTILGMKPHPSIIASTVPNPGSIESNPCPP